MLTAKTNLTDRVTGLKLGADDYLTKPFEAPQLSARVEALFRRARKGRPIRVVHFSFRDTEADFEKRDGRKKGLPGNLTGKELDLLQYLIDHRGDVVSREELLASVWRTRRGSQRER